MRCKKASWGFIFLDKCHCHMLLSILLLLSLLRLCKLQRSLMLFCVYIGWLIVFFNSNASMRFVTGYIDGGSLIQFIRSIFILSYVLTPLKPTSEPHTPSPISTHPQAPHRAISIRGTPLTSPPTTPGTRLETAVAGRLCKQWGFSFPPEPLGLVPGYRQVVDDKYQRTYGQTARLGLRCRCSRRRGGDRSLCLHLRLRLRG